jgi:Leu/Phe-tRNA-protein transferase
MNEGLKVRNLRIACFNAEDFYSLYRAGYYVNTNRRTGSFYWDHELDRHIIFVDENTARQARRVASEAEEGLQFGFCRNPSLVLDHLQDPKIKRGSWLTNKVREIYEMLLSQKFAFTIEVYNGSELVGGLFGIALGRLVTLDTMYGLPGRFRSASKTALCEAIIQMHAAGIKVVDVEVEHPRDHPAFRLGEQKLSMREFRLLLQEHANEGPELLLDHFSRCWIGSDV